MPTAAIYTLIYFTLALFFYSIGVWSERINKILKPWHLVFFGLGLIAETLGTAYVKKQTGFAIYNFLTIIGILSLLLMFIHTVIAIHIVIVNNKKQISIFHKISLFVWLAWLIPCLTMLFFGINK